MSRVHALVHQLNGRWFIEDCGSRNDTVVNDNRAATIAQEIDDVT